MNFLQTLWLKRSNRKLHRDIVSSVRHTLAEDDDILSDEEKAQLGEFVKAADEAKANPDPAACAGVDTFQHCAVGDILSRNAPSRQTAYPRRSPAMA